MTKSHPPGRQKVCGAEIFFPMGLGGGHVPRVFNRPEFSGRHDFQAKKIGRQ